MVDQEHEQVAKAWGAPGERGSTPERAGMPVSDRMGNGSIAGRMARGKGALATPDTLVGPAAWAAGEPAADVETVETEKRADGAAASVALAATGARPGAPLSSGEVLRTAWLRIRARQQLREFLRAVPRREAEATLSLVRADGSTRLIQRAELSTAIDRLRPRQRQIVRLSIEERWPRQRVCEYLRHISIKTFERDQMEALDRLAEL